MECDDDTLGINCMKKQSPFCSYILASNFDDKTRFLLISFCTKNVLLIFFYGDKDIFYVNFLISETKCQEAGEGSERAGEEAGDVHKEEWEAGGEYQKTGGGN